ncbi:hypothetical protein JCM10449v2_004480 [Rhodotorula kratochvilovae]
MSGSDSSAVTLARSTALVGLGYIAGLTVSIPAWTWPALYRPDSTLTPAQRLGLWSTVYAQGKRTMLLLVPGTTALLAFAAYAAKPPVPYLPAGWVARNRRGILGVSAAATFGIIGWTLAAMEGLNTQLRKVEKEANSGGAPVTPAHDALVRSRWLRLHLVRCALAFSALVGAVSELALA